jgi:peptidase M28-like protein/PDZ domain-containing protein/PA domain-containing protein
MVASPVRIVVAHLIYNIWHLSWQNPAFARMSRLTDLHHEFDGRKPPTGFKHTRQTDRLKPSMARRARLKNFLATILIGVTLGTTATIALTAWVIRPAAEAQSATSDLEEHVKYLASKELTGRGMGTPGIKLARDYIAAEFRKSGLRAGGDNATYFQDFDVAVGVIVKEPSTFSFASDPPLKLDQEWTPLGLSASSKVKAEIVFAGYGVTAKDYGYDDYAGIDVKGKIALVLRYEPPPKDSKSPFKKFPDYSIHSTLRNKANNARAHGAAGMILVDLNNPAGERDLLSSSSSLWRGGRSLVAAQVKREIMERQLAAHGISLVALKEKIDGSEKPASMPLSGLTAALEIHLEEMRERAENIVAVLSGGDPKLKNENIVIGAHYDHLGFGHFGARDPSAAGTIHFGADDNASGTAVLLDVARRFAQLPVKPARTLIFVAFSGEELGLYGSRYFVNRSPFILSTKAMINLDMVGRLHGNRLTVFGARSGENFSGIVTAAARQLDVNVTDSDDVGRSDHLSFYNKRIPVLHFFTGIHEDYHRASDTWDKLNYDGMARVSDLVMASVLRIADTREVINFVSLPSRPPREDNSDEPRLGTYLGSIPEYGANSTGVQLAGVMDGSPAALAGLRPGDVIIRFASKNIQSIEDLTAALGAQKPGDEVEIVALRAGKTVALRATLRARRANSSRG